MIQWLLPRWPMILIRAGFALFAMACIESDRLPVEALFIGPALMLAGVVQTISASSSELSREVRDRSAQSSRSPALPGPPDGRRAPARD